MNVHLFLLYPLPARIGAGGRAPPLPGTSSARAVKEQCFPVRWQVGEEADSIPSRVY
jgi:hypothetical protein